MMMNKRRNNGKFVEKHVFGTMTISAKKIFARIHVH